MTSTRCQPLKRCGSFLLREHPLVSGWFLQNLMNCSKFARESLEEPQGNPDPFHKGVTCWRDPAGRCNKVAGSSSFLSGHWLILATADWIQKWGLDTPMGSRGEGLEQACIGGIWGALSRRLLVVPETSQDKVSCFLFGKKINHLQFYISSIQKCLYLCHPQLLK